MKKALITGITGMDGSHLADFLLEKGYEVYGLERRSSTKNRVNIKHIENKINLIEGDLTDQMSLARCLKAVRPDEIYNLAAQSFVGESWNTPEQTSNVNGLGTLRMLEAIREFSADNSLLYEKGSRNTSNRKHTILSSFTIWCLKTICSLDYKKLQRILWYVCLLWYIV